MSTRSLMTQTSPLPSNVTRDAAVAQLHDHAAMIRVNPLVLRFEKTTAPAQASKDEAEFGTWYEITDRINYLPGINGQVSYKACFYNLPNGLQTHTFAPAGLDLRGKWLVCGSMPGEPREPVELGLDAPREGLYIKEEVDMRCNVLLTGFVKKNLRKSHAVVMSGLIERAGTGPLEEEDSNGNPPTSRPRFHPVGTINFSQRELRPPSDPAEGLTRPLHHSLMDTRRRPTNSHPVHIPGGRTLPPHCGCNAAFHLRTCAYFHPDDRGDTDVSFATSASPPRVQPATARRHTMSATPSVTSISPLSSRSSSPDNSLLSEHRLPELCGSVRSDQCLCTGAIHNRGCPGYPGLRRPGAATNSLSSSYHHHTSSTSVPYPTNSTNFTSSTPATTTTTTTTTSEQRMPVSPLPVYAHMLSAASPTVESVGHHLGGNTEFSVRSATSEEDEEIGRTTHNFSYSSPAFDQFTHT